MASVKQARHSQCGISKDGRVRAHHPILLQGHATACNCTRVQRKSGRENGTERIDNGCLPMSSVTGTAFHRSNSAFSPSVVLCRSMRFLVAVVRFSSSSEISANMIVIAFISSQVMPSRKKGKSRCGIICLRRLQHCRCSWEMRHRVFIKYPLNRTFYMNQLH